MQRFESLLIRLSSATVFPAALAEWATGLLAYPCKMGVIPGRMVISAPEIGLPPILDLSYDSQAALADDPTQAAIRKVVLTLDVPQVDRHQEPFPRMCQVARELARAMDGSITDDDGRSLSDAALQAIARDLQTLYDTLDARDLSAGSPQARRLFS